MAVVDHSFTCGGEGCATSADRRLSWTSSRPTSLPSWRRSLTPTFRPSPPRLAARLSPEDLADIAAGDITPETIQAFEAAAIGREAQDLKEFFEERAAILKHDGGLPRPEAELEAAQLTATLARNRSYSWASLRSALSDYPVLLAQVPDRPGPVDALPLGLPTVAVQRDKRVLRQGFTGAQEVKA